AAQEGDGLPGLLDRLGYEDPALDGVEHRDLVRHLLVQLPEREQRILLLRYYSNLTQSQISAELGVSQMHVSRLLARSFQRVRSADSVDAEPAREIRSSVPICALGGLYPVSPRVSGAVSRRGCGHVASERCRHVTFFGKSVCRSS